MHSLPVKKDPRHVSGGRVAAAVQDVTRGALGNAAFARGACESWIAECDERLAERYT